MRLRVFRCGLLELAASLALVLGARGQIAVSEDLSDPKTVQLGRAAAVSFCSSCHLAPEPTELDRPTWANELLPKMSYILGLAPPPAQVFNDLEVLQAAGFFPTNRLVPPAAWRQITNYFLRSAPAAFTNRHDQSQIQVGLPGFRVQAARHRNLPQLTSLTAVDTNTGAILVGDAQTQSLHVLDPEGKQVTALPLGNIPVSVSQDDSGFYLAAIGHFFPRDEPRGQVLFLEKHESGLRRHAWLSDLPRATHLELGDFNGDGKQDFALCLYGNYLGRFSWFERAETNRFIEHVLFDKPGAISSRALDVDLDGDLDLVVLVAQAQESIFLFFNDGSGKFERKTLVQRLPSWGHSSFELVDLTGDRRLDLLVTNGDNADFSTSPPKPYHGVRIYENDGKFNFREIFFYPIHGAYKAIARDFDQDGDPDIAVISFFPDYELGPRESFVFLQNQGRLKFKAFTFAECITGRWLTMDAGDIDQDGDIDLVLGSLVQMPTPVPDFLKKMWQDSGPSTLILLNTLFQAPKP